MTVAVIAVVLVLLALGIVLALSTRKRVLVVGNSPLALQVAREIERRPSRGWVLAGVVTSRTTLGATLERVRPDRVVLETGDADRSPLLAGYARHVVIEDAVDAHEWLTGRIATDRIASAAPATSQHDARARIDRALRRGLGVAVAALGLLVAAPLLAVIAIAIKLDSRGPVLFRHDRLGLDGRRFRLLKFRTMHPVDGPTSEWANDNRERITRIGRWLRRFGLDELPQFVNILRGDMTLVGPRPHPVSNGALFGETIPGYALRATARPGVTGWAQVRYGYANGLDEEAEKVQYDLYYIKHQSLGLDLLILLATIGIVVFGRAPERTRHPRPSRVPGHGVRSRG